jgi:GTPase SAR1 family protein
MRGTMNKESGKILLIGTPGSGKTTLAEHLARDFSLPYVSIDECRILYSDGTIVGENCAWDHFLDQCTIPGPCILEFSGMGPHAREVRDALIQSAVPVRVVWLVLPEIICKTRAIQRRKTIPFPYPLAPIGHAIPAIHAAIEDIWETIWNTEPRFRAMRLEFSGTEHPDEVCSVVRRTCGLPAA